MNNARAEFSPSTKRVLAQRAAYRCSNPRCSDLTIGPGSVSDDVEITGTASHIYAAADGGPRGTGGLSAEERSDPRNGIWLCAQCGRLVDTNAGGAYPAALLRGWRDLHETRVRLEHGGHARPFGWIASIEIDSDSWLAEPTTVQFSRCNLYMGPNNIGKTQFLSLLAALSAPSRIMERTLPQRSRVSAAINWYDPNPRRADFTAADGQLAMSVDGMQVPFVANPYQIIQFHSPWNPSGRVTDIARRLGLDPWQAKLLLQSVPELVRGAVRRITVEGNLINALMQHGDEEYLWSSAPDRPLNVVVAVELLVALAETHARVKPTLLVLDEVLDRVHPKEFR